MVATLVFMYLWCGGLPLGVLIMITSSICCGQSPEEPAATERRAALALRSLAAARRRAEVELMTPAVPVAAPKKLGHFPYSAEEGRRASSENLECAICLGVFEHGEECSEVPDCRHLFHRDCIAVWMKAKTTCPLCRRAIVPGSERVSAADDILALAATCV